MAIPATVTIYLVETGRGRAYFSTEALALVYCVGRTGIDQRPAVPKAVLTRAGSEGLWSVDSSL
jgi:hypothetical protein